MTASLYTKLHSLQDNHHLGCNVTQPSTLQSIWHYISHGGYLRSHLCKNISFAQLSLKCSDDFKTELEEPYEYSVHKAHKIKVHWRSCVHFATPQILNMPPVFTLSKQNSSYLLQFTQFWKYAGSPQSDLLSSVMGCIQIHNCQVNIAHVTSVNISWYQQSGLHSQYIQVSECLQMIPATQSYLLLRSGLM